MEKSENKEKPPVDQKFESLTRQQTRTLIYLESCSVDQSGKVAAVQMDRADFEVMKQWDAEGYIQYGRIPSSEIVPKLALDTHWVVLSDTAWVDAAKVRKKYACNRQKIFDDKQWRLSL